VRQFELMRIATLCVLAALLAAACGGSTDSVPPDASRGSSPEPLPPGTVTRGDATTDLETTPLSAADYAMYTAVMGGASAMLSTMTPADREALEFAKQVDAGAARVTPQNEHLRARARALQQKDLELARLQGIEDRYRQVKARVEAVIGPNAKPPAPDDKVAQENLHYLEPHRANIERLQKILRDPLSARTP
jgi:hypothetical protein